MEIKINKEKTELNIKLGVLKKATRVGDACHVVLPKGYLSADILCLMITPEERLKAERVLAKFYAENIDQQIEKNLTINKTR